MTRPARPLADALQDAPEAARLVARWQATQVAARCIAPLCEQLATGFDATAPGRCELRDAVLRLTATSAAQAAKLRQATPTLLEKLRAAAIQVYEIHIRLQPGITCYLGQGTGAPSSSFGAWSDPPPSAADTISELALTVEESPLKQSLQRLASTLARRSRRERT
jgi:hypothetical protein